MGALQDALAALSGAANGAPGHPNKAAARTACQVQGAVAPFYAGNFMVEAGYLDGPSDALLILINHNIQQEQADISLPDWAGSVQTLDGTPVEMEDGRIQVSLPPSEALVLRALKGARP